MFIMVIMLLVISPADIYGGRKIRGCVEIDDLYMPRFPTWIVDAKSITFFSLYDDTSKDSADNQYVWQFEINGPEKYEFVVEENGNDGVKINISDIDLERCYIFDETYYSLPYSYIKFRVKLLGKTESDNCVYHEYDSREVKVDIRYSRPKRPVLSNIHFENLGWEDECDWLTEDARLCYDMTWEQGDPLYWVYGGNGGNDYIYNQSFDAEEMMMFCYYMGFDRDNFCEIDGHMETHEEVFVDWGQLLFIAVYLGENGWSEAVPIFTTDYIDDPDILAKIEALRVETGVEEIRDSEFGSSAADVVVGKDGIYCSNGVQNLAVYNLDGQMVLEMRKNNGFIPVDYLPSGMYVIRYTNANSETKSLKFIR